MLLNGIDPGLKGAIAVNKSDCQPSGELELHVMPVAKLGTKQQIDERVLVEMFERLKLEMTYHKGHIMAYVEHVGSMPGQGVTSMFNFGMGWGLVRGILAGLGIPYELVRPQAWKKVMLAGMPKDSEYHVASRLWPTVNWKPTARHKNFHDGWVDAALISEFGRRRYGGINASAT